MAPDRDRSVGSSPAGWRAALDRRRSDIADLAGVADDLSAVDQRAAELDRRISELLALATSP